MINVTKDIYYQKEYASLYLNKGETIFEFTFQEGDFYLYNLAIKRPINEIAGKKLDTIYYDLETAYGYGGLSCNTIDKTFVEKALSAYSEKCREEKIIAEFSRFHPFNNFTIEQKDFFNFIVADRPTVYVNTRKNKEERWATYPSKVRTILRKCERELRLEKTEDVQPFINLYKQTMDRNSADEYYYFDEYYFKSLMKLEGVELYNVYQEENLVSSSFFLFSNSLGHYHLSANNYAFRKYNANYFILDQIFTVAKQKGVSCFHLGGGRSNQENDTLLGFKRKFSSLIKDFYIAGKIFNQEIYQHYIKVWEDLNPDKDVRYFLKYRL